MRYLLQRYFPADQWCDQVSSNTLKYVEVLYELINNNEHTVLNPIRILDTKTLKVLKQSDKK
jgi:hypothetical protein